jgi:hypothetical protein
LAWRFPPTFRKCVRLWLSRMYQQVVDPKEEKRNRKEAAKVAPCDLQCCGRHYLTKC